MPHGGTGGVNGPRPDSLLFYYISKKIPLACDVLYNMRKMLWVVGLLGLLTMYK